MKSVEVFLEIVAPLLLHGSDPKGQPELRPPAFRGAMRYWFRAAAGAVIGDQNDTSLRKLETAVFGVSEHGASPIAIRISQPDLERGAVPILPHHPPAKQGSSCAFKRGQTFSIQLSAYRPLPDAIWNCTLAAFALATTFGGVGLRSRRGYGTLRIISSSDPALPISPNSLEGWQQHVATITRFALQQILELATAQGVRILTLATGPSPYPAVNQMTTVRISDQTYADSETAVIELMKFMHAHHNRCYGGIGPRQSSPVWARVIQTGAKEYRLLFAVLASDFGNANYPKLDADLDKFPSSKILLKGWAS